MSQSPQLSLFETEPRKKIGHMPNNYYRALEQDVLQEALEVFRKHSNRYCCPGILSDLAQKHGLGGYWSATVHQLNSQGFFDVMNCYYGSDSPCDKTREYKGYLPHYRIKKEHCNDN